MAPRKEEKAKPGDASLRVTRSMAQSTVRETRSSSDSPAKKLAKLNPPKRKTKATAKTAAREKLEKEKEEEDNVEELQASEGAENGKMDKNIEEEIGAAVASKKIVIEHCKQCNAFKTRAIQVKSGLEKGVPGITVELNPEKPRRGCFEIRRDSGEIFISLQDMKRPFTPMKSMDMEEVIADILKKMK